MEPQLFTAAVDREFERLAGERSVAAGRAAELEREVREKGPPDTASLVLYKRMDELRAQEQRLSVEDLMYASVLERFLGLGVPLLPRLSDPVTEAPADLAALTDGLHSADALALVKDHLRGTLGPAATAFSNAVLRMSRLQAAQVYAASVLFGYFLRRVDARFQLERGAGMLLPPGEDAVARLEALFAAAADPEAVADPDKTSDEEDEAAARAGGGRAASASASPPPPPPPARRPGAALKDYIEAFDQATMLEMTRVVSAEGGALVEAQVSALFGDLGALGRQMAEAVGADAESMEDLMGRVQKAVADGTVETVALTAGTQRRAVLEAVAYGAFLRDVETHVGEAYPALLTAASRGPGGGGGPFGGFGGGGDGGGGGRGGGGGGGGGRRRRPTGGPGGQTATLD